MTKTQFRILVVLLLSLRTISGTYLDLAFPNESVDLVIKYSETLKRDWSDTQMFFIEGFSLLAGIFVF